MTEDGIAFRDIIPDASVLTDQRVEEDAIMYDNFGNYSYFKETIY